MPDLQERLRDAIAHRYHIQRELGSGGMATVYLADDLRHGRPVAVKVLRPELASALWSQRFLREIQIASRLQHPHILPLYDSGEAADILYYVMPFVAGESLGDRIRRERPLPIPEAVRLAREVADALAYAHGHGVVHRDIKPGNVLLSSGHALVCDFGIARALSLAAGDTPTEPGLALGTPSYMSPEQSLGDANVDARSDIYSLGCVLYEMLTGQPPYSGPTTLAVLAQHAGAAPPSVRTQRSSVPAAIDAAIIRALAKAPAERFATAAEFAAGLDTGVAPDPNSTGSHAPAKRVSIAVLPFANIGADPEVEYLSDGISEELIHALAHIPGLRVVARTSSFAFKGRREDVRSIGARLGVEVLVDGSVRITGDRIRISAQLVNPADGFELWSAQYERRTGDALVIEEEIAKNIAGVLRSRLLVEGEYRPVRGTPQDTLACESYLRGRYHWNTRTEAGLVRSIGYFEQAIARAPEDGPSHAALADAHLLLAIYGIAPPERAMPAARAAAERALRVETMSAEAHAALGSIAALYDWRWDAAEEHFRAAIEGGAGYPTAHQWMAMHLLAPLGRFEEARQSLARARELDPLSPAILTSVGVLSLFGRDYDRAVEEFGDVLDLAPGFAAAHYFMGQTQVRRARPLEAVAALQRAVALSGGSAETLAGLAHAHGIAGRVADAREGLRELTRRSERSYVSPLRIAQVHLGLGERQQSLRWLKSAVEQRATDLVWLGVNPVFDELRDESEFVEALTRVGLPTGGARIPAVSAPRQP